MNTAHHDRLVEDYLRRLETAAADTVLPPQRQHELVAEIRQHVEEALRDGPRDEAAVRNVLERLGSPQEIVDAAEPSPAIPLGSAGWRAWPRLELAALAAFTAGFLLAFLSLPPALVGWVVGGVLVLISQRWSGRDKLVALVILPLLAGALVWSTTSAHLRTGDEFLLGPVISAPLGVGYLGWRLGRVRLRSAVSRS